MSQGEAQGRGSVPRHGVVWVAGQGGPVPPKRGLQLPPALRDGANAVRNVGPDDGVGVPKQKPFMGCHDATVCP